MTRPLVIETVAPESQSPEAHSGLDPWRLDELPSAPTPRVLGWFSAFGAVVIALGVSLGSGECLLVPASIVKYELPHLWFVGEATLLQTLLIVEMKCYTLVKGEPVFIGF